MQFDSLTFVLFLAATCGLFYACRSVKSQKVVLLVASYLFYAAWNPYFTFLIVFSTLVDWFVADKIIHAQKASVKRNWLLVSLTSNLGLLGYFKYGGFLLDNFVTSMALMGIDYIPPDINIILPIGISFYTFQTLSYTIDAYRGERKQSASLLDFSMYVSFFPQLVAGPIVRAHDFLPQCSEKKVFNIDNLGWGSFLIVNGLFTKVVLSDTFLAPFVDEVYEGYRQAGTVQAWTAIFAFSGQIFFDFSGYSLCALGTAKLVGYTLPWNFHSPYSALGFSDFWRRWHISLSSWLRDYLYISLGGNRKGAFRTYVNLMITMFLGGLWHGASWQFVIWGVCHGTYLIVEHGLKKVVRIPKAWINQARLLLALITFFIVSLTWLPFRARSMDQVNTLLSTLFNFKHPTLII